MEATKRPIFIPVFIVLSLLIIPFIFASDTIERYPFDVCAVTGKKLGSMGEPYVFVHKGREVKLASKQYLPDFYRKLEIYAQAKKEEEKSKVVASEPAPRKMQRVEEKPPVEVVKTNPAKPKQVAQPQPKPEPPVVVARPSEPEVMPREPVVTSRPSTPKPAPAVSAPVPVSTPKVSPYRNPPAEVAAVDRIPPPPFPSVREPMPSITRTIPASNVPETKPAPARIVPNEPEPTIVAAVEPSQTRRAPRYETNVPRRRYNPPPPAREPQPSAAIPFPFSYDGNNGIFNDESFRHQKKGRRPSPSRRKDWGLPAIPFPFMDFSPRSLRAWFHHSDDAREPCRFDHPYFQPMFD